jgi:2-amino-4-hydroxy-6-hydroxymethyldihydropteridine diphosphokinase
MSDRATSTPSEVWAFIALGANVGDAKGTVQSAIRSMAALPHTRLVRVSSLYRTAPVDADGPDFINAVLSVLTNLGVHELLSQLQQIECLAGRTRPYKNAPRTLDLDILLYGQVCLDSPTLQVPHPRMAQRAFVLVPLSEIAPHLVSTTDLDKVASQTICRLSDEGDVSIHARV